MATTRYTVYALSPALNQRVRMFNLAHIDQDITHEQALQDARAFAELKNKERYLHTSDWQALVELEQHGIDTIPGFLAANQ